MSSRKDRTLVPRNGHVLMIGIVARISGSQNQKEQSLEDQVEHGKQIVRDMYDGPVDYIPIATKGKGERLDRPELAEVERLLRSRKLDGLVVEDLGRLCRGVTAAWLCGIAVDHAVRVLAPNDDIDTADPCWEEQAIQACRDHVGHNAHTSKRLKQKLMNRFKSLGGATARETYGYIKPPGAKTYDEFIKDETATPIFEEWFRMLDEDPNCEVVADWLVSQGVPLGKYARGKKWTGKMVRRLTRNPMLKGFVGRGFTVTTKHHETGRRIAMHNPDGPTLREFSHLAHLSPEVFDAVNAKLRLAGKKFERKLVDGQDPRAGIAKRRTLFPGQHAQCGICGRWYYWGGHGQTDRMMCSGNREYQCWNGATFDGKIAAERIGRAVYDAIESLDGFDDDFRRRVQEQLSKAGIIRKEADARIEAELAGIKKSFGNILEAIELNGPSKPLLARIRELEDRQEILEAELIMLHQPTEELTELPPIDELKKQARDSIKSMPSNDPAFGRIMRVLAPKILLFPFQEIDSDRIIVRARVTVELAGLLSKQHAQDATGILRKEIWVDLYDPPQRIALLKKIVELRSQKLTEREVAEKLGIQQPTVQLAMRLHRKLRAMGIEDPYVLIAAPGERPGRLKRHLKARYCFEPLPDFPALPED